MLNSKRFTKRIIFMLFSMAFLATPFTGFSTETVSIQITNGCPENPPYFGDVTFHFDNFVDEVHTNFPAGSSSLDVPEIPSSATINGSTAYHGSTVTFQDAGQTGLMIVAETGQLWHFEK